MRRRMGVSSATTRNNTRKEDEDVVEDVVVFEIVLFFISYLAHSTQCRVFALLAYQLVGRSVGYRNMDYSAVARDKMPSYFGLFFSCEASVAAAAATVAEARALRIRRRRPNTIEWKISCGLDMMVYKREEEERLSIA
jgi:hypothetical protein